MDLHTIEAVDGLNNFARTDRVFLGMQSVAFAAGAAAGDSVTATVTWNEPLPTTYEVFFAPQADIAAYVSAPTALGFTVNVQPRLATETIAAGNIGVLVVA